MISYKAETFLVDHRVQSLMRFSKSVEHIILHKSVCKHRCTLFSLSHNPIGLQLLYDWREVRTGLTYWHAFRGQISKLGASTTIYLKKKHSNRVHLEHREAMIERLNLWLEWFQFDIVQHHSDSNFPKYICIYKGPCWSDLKIIIYVLHWLLSDMACWR